MGVRRPAGRRGARPSTSRDPPVCRKGGSAPRDPRTVESARDRRCASGSGDEGIGDSRSLDGANVGVVEVAYE